MKYKIAFVLAALVMVSTVSLAEVPYTFHREPLLLRLK